MFLQQMYQELIQITQRKPLPTLGNFCDFELCQKNNLLYLSTHLTLTAQSVKKKRKNKKSRLTSLLPSSPHLSSPTIISKIRVIISIPSKYINNLTILPLYNTIHFQLPIYNHYITFLFKTASFRLFNVTF